MQNNSNKNSLLCLVVAFFFNFIKSSHSVISIIPFITFLMNFKYLCFRWTTHQWHCGYDFASEWTVMLLLFFLFSHRLPHLYLTLRAMIRFVCCHCLGIRRLRAGHDYQRFSTRFSSPAGQCDALSNGNRREICKGSGTDNYYSAQISGKPLQDSSQIFPRMEKHASCSAYNEVLLAG